LVIYQGLEEPLPLDSVVAAVESRQECGWPPRLLSSKLKGNKTAEILDRGGTDTDVKDVMKELSARMPSPGVLPLHDAKNRCHYIRYPNRMMTDQHTTTTTTTSACGIRFCAYRQQ
jgi:hypothetical protein